jgi:uncharacterized protein
MSAQRRIIEMSAQRRIIEMSAQRRIIETRAGRFAGTVLVFAAALALPTGVCSKPRVDQEVSFRNGNVTLAGTLSLPAAGAGRFPVAVLISGDGPQDRDGAPGTEGLYRALADALVAEGVAVLRHDDRGAGRSSAPVTPPSYRALLGDTRAAIAFVRSRRELDGERVVLIGHSEGGKTAAILAAEDPRIAAIAILAGATAVNVDTLLMEQARSMPGGPASRLLDVVAAARSGARATGPGDLTDWMREHLEIAPRRFLPRVRCPVLIASGDADHLVPAHHALEAAQMIRAAGNRRVVVRSFAGLSHVFNRWRPGVATSAEERRVDPAVPRELAAWVKATIGGRAGAGAGARTKAVGT